MTVTDPRIENWLLTVDPQLDAVLGLDDEFIRARLGRENGAPPARGKFLRLEAFALRGTCAPVEIHRAFHTIKGLLFVVVAASFVPCAGEAALFIEGACTPEKFPHQIRDALLVLPASESADHHPRRLVARLRVRRIEGVVNILGHLRRILAHA